MHLTFNVIILAGGNGKRMGSHKTKIFLKLGGRELIYHVINTAIKLSYNQIVVVVSNTTKEKLISDTQKYFPDHKIDIATQPSPLGTANAVITGYEYSSSQEKSNNNIGNLILLGDTPFINADDIQNGINKYGNTSDIIIFGMTVNQKNDYGKICYDNKGNIEKIIEEKFIKYPNNTSKQCNSGVIFLSHKAMNLLFQIEKKSEEYMLTDIIEIAYSKYMTISYVECNEIDMTGINSAQDLFKAEKIFQNTKIHQLWEKGVTFISPETIHLSFDTEIEEGSTIYPNNFFDTGVKIEQNVKVLPHCYLSNCNIKSDSSIGPFATIKESTIHDYADIGNFVEINRSIVGRNTKSKHLSYVGDATIGNSSNIGAGVIFCNFDGVKKNKANIGNNVFIGSNSSIISPRIIDDNAIITAGSVVNKNVENDAIYRSKPNHHIIPNASKKLKNLL